MIKKDGLFEQMKYTISYPDNYEADKKYPVILFLHGAGSRGSDISLLKSNPYFRITDNIEHFPFITIAPLCHENTWFDLFETLKRFAVFISKLRFADENRIYAMGASMGGYAIWQLAMSIPEVFAAIVPICGGGMYWNADRLVNLPIWAFHGAKDGCVKPEESKKMVDAVNKSGGNAKLTVYPENGHDAWSDTYADIEVYDWLLSNVKKQSPGVTGKQLDSVNFG